MERPRKNKYHLNLENMESYEPLLNGRLIVILSFSCIAFSFGQITLDFHHFKYIPHSRPNLNYLNHLFPDC